MSLWMLCRNYSVIWIRLSAVHHFVSLHKCIKGQMPIKTMKIFSVIQHNTKRISLSLSPTPKTPTPTFIHIHTSNNNKHPTQQQKYETPKNKQQWKKNTNTHRSLETRLLVIQPQLWLQYSCAYCTPLMESKHVVQHNKASINAAIHFIPFLLCHSCA